MKKKPGEGVKTDGMGGGYKSGRTSVPVIGLIPKTPHFCFFIQN